MQWLYTFCKKVVSLEKIDELKKRVLNLNYTSAYTVREYFVLRTPPIDISTYELILRHGYYINSNFCKIKLLDTSNPSVGR